MLYPINSHESRNNIAFKKHIRRIAPSNPEAVATINYRLQEKINILKSVYLEMVNRVKNNSVLASKMASGINNIRIDDSIITVLGKDNTSIKLSMLEVGISKLFRIKFLENKELKKMITVDNYKLVERVNKNDIIYLKREDVNEEEITSSIENLYKTLDEPFLELKKYMRSNDFTKVEIPKEKSFKFKPVLEKKEIIPGVTADMLPTSRLLQNEEKPLFSYAALRDKTESLKTSEEPSIKPKRRGRPPKAESIAKKEANTEFSAEPKRRGRPPKAESIVKKEANTELSAEPKRRGRPPKAKTVKLSSTNQSRKRIDNSTAGQLPKSIIEKIQQIEALSQEISSIWKNFSHSKLVRIKKIFNVSTRKKHGLYFDEPNGDKFSVIKLNRKDFKDSNLLKISFNSGDNTQNIFAVIDNAKNLVSNISGKNHQAFYSKLRYQTQNEVNSIVYQGNLQVTIDKIINKLSELKKSLVNEEWKKQPQKHYSLDETVYKDIEVLWENLKSIEKLGTENKFPKRDFDILKTQRGFGGFDFIKDNCSILFDKNTNRYGTQFRIVFRENDEIKESFMITADRKIVKNTKNGAIPHVGNLVYVKEDDFSSDMLENLKSLIKSLEKLSTEYRKETAQKIYGVSSQEIRAKNNQKMVNAQYDEVKSVMDNAVEDLENTLNEIKENFGIVYKFNEVVNKIKKDFKKFLSKFSKNK